MRRHFACILLLAACERAAPPPPPTSAAAILDSAQTLPASEPVEPAIALDQVAAAIQAGAGSGRVPLLEKPAVGS